jgi:PleD family two-component response regulator
LGLATHHPGAPFQTVSRLLAAADISGYAAKRSGRDRLVIYGTIAA